MLVQDVWIVGETAPDLAGFMQTVTGAKIVKTRRSAKIRPSQRFKPEPAPLCWLARKRLSELSACPRRIQKMVRISLP